ncbi:MAG: hypothetical protein AB8B99_18850 [Phormidesmis sp.]
MSIKSCSCAEGLQEKNQAQPVRSEKPASPAAAPVVVENESTGFEWRSVPNAELNGDRRHDAYAEKLRRSVEAIQEYNAGLPHDEQFSVTGALLRQITKVKPGKVKQWMDTYQAELDSYNSGFHSRQNTGKPALRVLLSRVRALMESMSGSETRICDTL